ncbi:MAG: TIGR03915 family putative DNA repair protein [Peptococcus niger]|nr:TIGR03915 family putative DNA repair protein [Peptococcus niger]
MMVAYDGSFEGLLTVVFDHYKDLEDIHISPPSEQAGLFDQETVATDWDKAQRVAQGVCQTFSKRLLEDLYKVYRSKNPEKEETVAHIIKGLYQYGPDYLYSAEKYPLLFRQILKNFSSENHAYKGLLRFRQIQDGFLYGEMAPENDILEYLTRHFMKRMPKEKFIIYDKKREKASICLYGKLEIVRVVEMRPEDTDEEKVFKSAWRTFYQAIGIDERKNERLMAAHMPKKYWRYLPEKNPHV